MPQKPTGTGECYISTAMAEFVPLTAPNPITEYAVSLVAWNKDSFDPMGSGVIITPELALTARHVFDDYRHRLGW